MWTRRSLLASATASAVLGARRARAGAMPGVTATEIKIGQTMPYSGPVSAWGTVGKAEVAYIEGINAAGGVNGRKITLISLDDSYSPPKTVEQTRKIVEQEDVAFIYTAIGVAPGLAVRHYLNDHHVPQIFALAPVEAFKDPQHYPWSIGLVPTLYLNAKMMAQYILKHRPDARVGVVYQNDDAGKEHLRALTDGLGAKAGTMIVKVVSYEVTDPTVDSQIVELKGSGADTFYNTGSTKFASQAIRKAYDLDWKPLQLMSYTSSSVPAVLRPAGLDKAAGIISAAYAKDPTDPQWTNDPEVIEYFAWLEKQFPGTAHDDNLVAAGYVYAATLVALLKLCGDDLSRETIMHQATTLHGPPMPLLLPGITITTSPTAYQPIRQMRFQRFNGERWELLDEMAGGPVGE